MNWKLIRIIDSLIGIPYIKLCSLFKSSQIASHHTPQKILLIKFWGIGNIFMLLPSITALQKQFPQAQIDFLTLENNREALSILNITHHTYTINTKTPLSFLKSWYQVVAKLRLKNCDTIIDFEQFSRFSALLTCQLGRHQTIGFNTWNQHRHHLYTDPVPYNNDIHITQSFYDLVLRAGVSSPFTPAVHIEGIKELHSKGLKLLASHNIPAAQPIAVLHIGTSTNFSERRWSPQNYAALADYLTEQHNFYCLLTGLPEEMNIIELTKKLITTQKSINLGGELSFSEYLFLITCADLVISADTSAVHLASSVNTPVVGLYGPNSSELYGPWGVNGTSLSAHFECSPCITNFNGKIHTCRHPKGKGACMSAITVTNVVKTIEENYLLPDAPWQLQKLKKITG